MSWNHFWAYPTLAGFDHIIFWAANKFANIFYSACWDEIDSTLDRSARAQPAETTDSLDSGNPDY